MSNHSGLVALIGRPNVGKSSLLNALLHEKIAIVSPKVQTTRNKILGVLTVEKNTTHGQIVFCDLPGVHSPLDQLGQFCLDTAYIHSQNADLVVFCVDMSSKPGGRDDLHIRDWLQQHVPQQQTMLLLNKLDKVPTAQQSTRMDEYTKFFSGVPAYAVSARSGSGLAEFTDACLSKLPEGDNLYADDILTDSSVRFLAAEFIREACLHNLDDELPHSIAVKILDFVEQAELTTIRAIICVERESQKGIVIGQGGKTIKKISTEARLSIEQLLETKVFLETKVKVVHGFRSSQNKLAELGYIAP